MYTRLSRKVRIMILSALTVLLIITIALTNYENLLPALIGGVIIGLLLSELSIYLPRKHE